ncbi:MAG: zf-HC2 domain-containing protein [Bacteroidota bacterium]
MTPLPCHTLDAYLDGDLSASDAASFEAHAESCAECSADLAASRLLQAEWDRLAAIQAPEGLVESALRDARRAPGDRQPVPAPRRTRRRLAGFVTVGALLVALAATALWMRQDTSPAPSLQASADTPVAADTRPPSAPETPVSDTPQDDTPASQREPQLESLPPPRRAPRARPAQRPHVAPAPAVASPEQLVGIPAPPADSVAQAQEELMLALTLIADAQSHARSTISTELGRAAGTLTETSVF